MSHICGARHGSGCGMHCNCAHDNLAVGARLVQSYRAAFGNDVFCVTKVNVAWKAVAT